MKQYTYKEFSKILKNNDYYYKRCSGSHYIYYKNGNHISVPRNLNACIARRLIKENNLKL